MNTQHESRQIILGNHDAAVLRSEQALVDLLQRSRRPVRDASFTRRANVWSKSASLTVGGLTITAACCSPVRFVTSVDRQHTLVLLTSGSGRISDRQTSISFGGEQILRCSFSKSTTVEYGEYSGVSIQVNVRKLMDALQIKEEKRDYVSDLLLDVDTELIPQSSARVAYYASMLSIVRMMDHAGQSEDYIRSVGIDALLMRLIADFTLNIQPELGQFVARE